MTRPLMGRGEACAAGLVRKAKRKAIIKKVLGDGGYDTHDNFKFLASCGIEAGIKVREDSDPNCGGSRQEGRWCELI